MSHKQYQLMHYINTLVYFFLHAPWKLPELCNGSKEDQPCIIIFYSNLPLKSPLAPPWCMANEFWNILYNEITTNCTNLNRYESVYLTLVQYKKNSHFLNKILIDFLLCPVYNFTTPKGWASFESFFLFWGTETEWLKPCHFTLPHIF